MNIGETIKKLRKQKDMTQEQLAEYLNISPQAISRWEINSTLPDITLIPMLANIFDVTTDTLLGVDIDAKEKRIEEIAKEANIHFYKHQYDEAEKLLRTALKEYPNSYNLMDKLALILHSNRVYYNGRNGNEEEIITLSEKILAECTDDNLRYYSIQRLCTAYASTGETAKAASFAKKMPNATQEDMITVTLKGTKKYNHMQQQIAKGAFWLLNSIALLIHEGYASLDDGTEPYNSDEWIALHHKIIDIINILIEEGSFGDFTRQLVNSHRKLASLYVQKGDAAAALNHFRLAAKHAVIFDSVNDNTPLLSEEYTSLLFKGVKFPSVISHPPDNMTESLLDKSRELDSVLPASELEEIRNELRKHAAV